MGSLKRTNDVRRKRQPVSKKLQHGPPAAEWDSTPSLVASSVVRDLTLTELLSAAGRGDDQALARAFERVYDDLRRLARRRVQGAPTTLSATALIHELYLRLEKNEGTLTSRAHFFSVAARAMRQIVVDYARRHGALKRGGRTRPLSLDDAEIAVEDNRLELLGLDQALERLAEVDPRLVKLVELRFFGGFGEQETAELLGVSLSTVQRDWRRAKAWLRVHLENG